MEFGELMDLYRVNKTVHEMLHSRNYLISQKDIEMTFEDFKTKIKADTEKIDFNEIREHMSILARHKENSQRLIFVLFRKLAKISTDDITKLANTMDTNKAESSILVANGDITAVAKSVQM